MRIGRPDGWWNRKIPIARIGLIAVALFLGFYIWGAYGDLIGTVFWDIRHQRTASFRGQTLRLPWLWREEEWKNYNKFDLERNRGRLDLPALVTITYEGAKPGDMERMWLSIKNHLVNPPFSVPGRLNPEYEGDDFNRTRYVCLQNGSNWSPILWVQCFSRDGRWTVDFFGSRQSLPEFEMILRGVTSMGNPTK
jgi:hypothetical protein